MIGMSVQLMCLPLPEVQWTLVGHRGSRGNSRSPPPNWHVPSSHCSSHDFGGSIKCPPEKQTSQHLIFDTMEMDTY